MVRSSAIALAVAISLGTLGLTTGALARGGGFGGGHFGGGFDGGFGGGHFGGGFRDFGGGHDFGGGNASAKAASVLQATCPSQIPDTTEGRLEAMAKRLKATTMAMNEVRPALVGFYDLLSDEQKARFDTMAGH